MIDPTAAGLGWFVDATPWDDHEFIYDAEGSVLRATSSAVAAQAVDLVSAVTHELGHLLGFEHDEHESHFMHHELAVGERKLQASLELRWEDHDHWDFEHDNALIEPLLNNDLAIALRVDDHRHEIQSGFQYQADGGILCIDKRRQCTCLRRYVPVSAFHWDGQRSKGMDLVWLYDRSDTDA